MAQTVPKTLAILAALVASGIAGCAGAGPGVGPGSSGATTAHPSAPPAAGLPAHLFFDFGGEQAGPGDLTGWRPAADVPDDPNRPGQTVAWNVTACDEAGWEDHVHIQAHPVHSACFRLDGRQDDGTVWIERPLGSADGRPLQVDVRVRALGQESFNRIADIVLRVGLTQAREEADFTTAQDTRHGASRAPLDQATGWTEYNLTWQATPQVGAAVYLAMGISAVWETEMTRYLDALAVDVTYP